MVDFASAPALLRCCMLIVTARTGLSEEVRVGSAFAGADADADGRISQEEFANAILNTSSCGWMLAEVDAETLFSAADLAGSGCLSYLEFAAACLFASYGWCVDRLAEEAFEALDDDRDRWVRLRDFSALFTPKAIASLGSLPQERPFRMNEWRDCVRDVVAKFRDKHPDNALPVQSPEDAGWGNLLGAAFLRRFLCASLLCCSCEQNRALVELGLHDGDLAAGPRPMDPNLEVPVHSEDL
jgi:Ca2+-binding EF-hand superfamily protein